MRRFAPLLPSLLLLVCLPVSGQDLKITERQLQAVYQGKVLIVRGFYRGEKLRYDVDGNLLEGGQPGPWTLTGKIEVTRVQVSENELAILGNRLYLRYDRGKKQFQHLRGDDKVRISIATGKTIPSLPAFARAIERVFMSGDELADRAPLYWKTFLRGNPVEECPTTSASGNGVMRVGQDVPEPKRLSFVTPEYSQVPLRGQRGFKMRLATVVNERGEVESVRIVEPAGMGLDDVVVGAVRQWKYEPTSVSGRAVPVCMVSTEEVTVYP